MKGKQYNQALSAKEASYGIKLAMENSVSLFEDSKLLFDNSRFERSVALAILAIEEAGKPSIIRGIIVEDDPKLLKKEWQRYRSHTEKNIIWIAPDLINKGANNIDDMRQIVDGNSDHKQVLDSLKQLALYTDVFENCVWSSPKNAVDEELAKITIKIAEDLVMATGKTMATEEELTLWIKHLKPVWKHDMATMKQALINCYQEAESLNLIEKNMTSVMLNFLNIA